MRLNIQQDEMHELLLERMWSCDLHYHGNSMRLRLSCRRSRIR